MQDLTMIYNDILGYQIAYSPDPRLPIDSWTVYTVSADAEEHYVTRLKPDTDYYFKIRSVGTFGSGTYSSLMSRRTEEYSKSSSYTYLVLTEYLFTTY